MNQTCRPDWKWRLAITIMIALTCIVVSYTYHSIQGPIEAELAVKQLDDSATSYSVVKAIISDNLVLTVMYFISTLVLLILWVPYTYRIVKLRKQGKITITIS